VNFAKINKGKFVKKVLAFLFLFVYNNECATAQMEGAGKLFLSVQMHDKKAEENKKF